MKALLQAYDELVDKHQSRFESIENQQYTVKFSAHDFFSLEPFYHEINNIPVSQAKFYDDQDELPEDGYLYICAIIENRLAYVRNSFGSETFYDSFFTYENNETWRLEVYANEQDKKPVKVERLLRDEDGRYISYEVYSEHGYQKFSYNHTTTGLEIAASYYDAKHKHYMDRNFQVIIDYSENCVESILEIADKNHVLIYDRTLSSASLQDLLKHVQSTIIETVLSKLKTITDIKDTIDFMVLEYTLQHPFPPTLAMDYRPADDDIDYPLEIYNAPDMRYFSEEGLGIDLHSEHAALYNTLNSRLEELRDQGHDQSHDQSHDESHDEPREIDEDLDIDHEDQYSIPEKMVFEAYCEICRELKKRIPAMEKKFQVSGDFHVIARDFEQCNEFDFIKELFSQQECNALEKKLHAYEKKSVLSDQDQALLEHLEKTLDEEEKKYDALKSALQKKNTLSVYSREQRYYLLPFGHEIKTHQKSKSIDFKNTDDFTTQPEGDSYYEYILDKNELACIAAYQNGELRTEQFYSRTDSAINEWHFQHYEYGLEPGSFEVLHLKDNQPIKHELFLDSHIETTDYHHDNKGNITTCKIARILIDRKFIHKNYNEHHYRYRETGELQRITDIYANGEKSRVIYCIDDSYMHECIHHIVGQCHDRVLANITAHNIKDAIAIVLEKDRDPILPFYYFYLLMPGMENSIHWERVDTLYSSVFDDNIFINFTLYTSKPERHSTESYFTAKECEKYIEQALTDITHKVQSSIKEKFDKEINIYIKPLTESTERLDKIILKERTG